MKIVPLCLQRLDGPPFCHALGIQHLLFSSSFLLEHILPPPHPCCLFLSLTKLISGKRWKPLCVWDAGFWTTCCKLVSLISCTAFTSRKTGRGVGHQIEVLFCPQLPRVLELMTGDSTATSFRLHTTPTPAWQTSFLEAKPSAPAP